MHERLKAYDMGPDYGTAVAPAEVSHLKRSVSETSPDRIAIAITPDTQNGAAPPKPSAAQVRAHGITNPVLDLFTALVSRTLFLPRGKVRPQTSCMQRLPQSYALLVPARCKQDPVNRGHDAQHFHRPPPLWDLLDSSSKL